MEDHIGHTALHWTGPSQEILGRWSSAQLELEELIKIKSKCVKIASLMHVELGRLEAVTRILLD